MLKWTSPNRKKSTESNNTLPRALVKDTNATHTMPAHSAGESRGASVSTGNLSAREGVGCEREFPDTRSRQAGKCATSPEKVSGNNGLQRKKRAASTSLPNSPHRWKKSLEQINQKKATGLMSKVRSIFRRSSSKSISSKDRKRGSSLPSTPKVSHSFRHDDCDYSDKKLSPDVFNSKFKSRLLRKMESRKQQRKLIRSLNEKRDSDDKHVMMLSTFDYEDPTSQFPSPTKQVSNRVVDRRLSLRRFDQDIMARGDRENNWENTKKSHQTNWNGLQNIPIDNCTVKSQTSLKHGTYHRSTTLNSLMNPFGNKKGHKRLSLGSDGSVGLYENHVVTENMTNPDMTSIYTPINKKREPESPQDSSEHWCHHQVLGTKFNSTESIISALEYEQSLAASNAAGRTGMVKVMPVDALKLIQTKMALTPPKERDMSKITSSKRLVSPKSDTSLINHKNVPIGERGNCKSILGARNNNNGHHDKKTVSNTNWKLNSFENDNLVTKNIPNRIQIDHMESPPLAFPTETIRINGGYSLSGSKERLNILQSPRSLCLDSPPYIPETNINLKQNHDTHESCSYLRINNVFDIDDSVDPQLKDAIHIEIEPSPESIGFSPVEILTDYDEAYINSEKEIHDISGFDNPNYFNLNTLTEDALEMKTFDEVKENIVVSLTKGGLDKTGVGNSDIKLFDEAKKSMDSSHTLNSRNSMFTSVSSAGTSWGSEATSQVRDSESCDQVTSHVRDSESRDQVTSHVRDSEPRDQAQLSTSGTVCYSHDQTDINKDVSRLSELSLTFDSQPLPMDIDDIPDAGVNCELTTLTECKVHPVIVETSEPDSNTKSTLISEEVFEDILNTNTKYMEDVMSSKHKHIYDISDIEAPSDLISTLLSSEGNCGTDGRAFSIADIEEVLPMTCATESNLEMCENSCVSQTAAENSSELLSEIDCKISTSSSLHHREAHTISIDDVRSGYSENAHRPAGQGSFCTIKQIADDAENCDVDHLTDLQGSSGSTSAVMSSVTSLGLDSFPESEVAPMAFQVELPVALSTEDKAGSTGAIENKSDCTKNPTCRPDDATDSGATGVVEAELGGTKSPTCRPDVFIMPDDALHEFQTPGTSTGKVQKRVSFNLDVEAAYISEPTVTSDDCAVIENSSPSQQTTRPHDEASAESGEHVNDCNNVPIKEKSDSATNTYTCTATDVKIDNEGTSIPSDLFRQEGENDTDASEFSFSLNDNDLKENNSRDLNAKSVTSKGDKPSDQSDDTCAIVVDSLVDGSKCDSKADSEVLPVAHNEDLDHCVGIIDKTQTLYETTPQQVDISFDISSVEHAEEATWCLSESQDLDLNEYGLDDELIKSQLEKTQKGKYTNLVTSGYAEEYSPSVASLNQNTFSVSRDSSRKNLVSQTPSPALSEEGVSYSTFRDRSEISQDHHENTFSVSRNIDTNSNISTSRDIDNTLSILDQENLIDLYKQRETSTQCTLLTEKDINKKCSYVETVKAICEYLGHENHLATFGSENRQCSMYSTTTNSEKTSDINKITQNTSEATFYIENNAGNTGKVQRPRSKLTSKFHETHSRNSRHWRAGDEKQRHLEVLNYTDSSDEAHFQSALMSIANDRDRPPPSKKIRSTEKELEYSPRMVTQGVQCTACVLQQLDNSEKDFNEGYSVYNTEKKINENCGNRMSEDIMARWSVKRFDDGGRGLGTHWEMNHGDSYDVIREGHSAPSTSLHRDIAHRNPRHQDQSRHRLRQNCGHRRSSRYQDGHRQVGRGYDDDGRDSGGCHGSKRDGGKRNIRGLKRGEMKDDVTREDKDWRYRYWGDGDNDQGTVGEGPERRPAPTSQSRASHPATSGASQSATSSVHRRARDAMGEVLACQPPQWLFLSTFFLFQFLLGWFFHGRGD